MKKIINGKSYDTTTAECVGSWSNGHPYGDFSYCGEDLYRKRTGEFFLYGEGGAYSRYSRRCGDNWGCGESIIPLTYAAAQKWAEENLSGEKYEAIFGEVAEDDSRVALTLSLASSVVEKAKRDAAKAGMSLSAYIEAALCSKEDNPQ